MARTKRARTDLRELIRKLDARCRAQAAGLPDDSKPPDSWPAVLFRVGNQPFLTPLEQLAEVLELPAEVTRVPGTKSWLLGVANNRGTLLPIFDLAALLQGSPSPTGGSAQRAEREHRGGSRRSRERILVVRQDESPCGLVVSEAVGMRHIKLGDRLEGVPEGLGAGRPYAEESFLLEGTSVPVIQLAQLITDPLFNSAMA